LAITDPWKAVIHLVAGCTAIGWEIVPAIQKLSALSFFFLRRIRFFVRSNSLGKSFMTHWRTTSAREHSNTSDAASKRLMSVGLNGTDI
jgi:hypothetical protein